MRRRFFVDRFDGSTARLEGEAARHLATVLRAEPGREYELSDGQRVFLARITEARHHSVTFALAEEIPAQGPSLQIDLLLAVVKFDRFEWAIEKATELGISSITPIAAERSEKGLLAAAPKRAARWQKILFESAQQSRRLAPPTLYSLAEFSAVVQLAHPAAELRIIFSERQDAAALRSAIEEGRAKSPGRVNHVAIAIGPEGGWTDEEISLATQSGFLAASLGPLILRTETAVTSAIANLHYGLGA
jgi:16S rRNA (uracil1498-N3)-methyltransferase